MARSKIKTEMKGTGGGRWCPRAEAKSDSKVRRRQADRKECEAGEAEVEAERAYRKAEVNDESNFRTDPLYRLVSGSSDDRGRE